MVNIILKSSDVGEIENGGLASLSYSIGTIDSIMSISRPGLKYVPDLAINILEVITMVMFLLIVKGIIAISLIYVSIPFGMCVLCYSIFLLTKPYFHMPYYLDVERKRKFAGIKSESKKLHTSLITRLCSYSGVLLGFLSTMFLCVRYTYSLQKILDVAPSLDAIIRLDIQPEIISESPFLYFQLDVAAIVFQFASQWICICGRFFPDTFLGKTSVTLSLIDNFALTVYLLHYRRAHSTNDLAYFNSLFRSLPFLLLGLSIWRCMILRLKPTAEHLEEPGLYNANFFLIIRSISLIICIVCVTYHKSALELVLFILCIAAIFERIVFAVHNVLLIKKREIRDTEVA